MTETRTEWCSWDRAFAGPECIAQATRIRDACPSDADDEENVMDPTQSEVTALLDSQADAMRTKNLDGLMSLYSPDVAYFDTVPPLQYAGSAALRERFLRWFDGWEGSFEMEVRDIHVVAS